jgi:hypothetical protein
VITDNICPANQVAEYMKEIAIQGAHWTRQNGAKKVEIVRVSVSAGYSRHGG